MNSGIISYKKSSTPPSLLNELKTISDQELEIALAKNDYSFYCEYVHKGIYIPARHTDYLSGILEQVEQGDITRLMIFMPPRHSKSMTVSETFPSYFIGKNPNRRVIEVSYGDNLAQKFGMRNRQKIEEYGASIFGIEIDDKNASKTNWGIKGYRGGMISAGLGGSITGEGADLLLIDDPYKNRQQANSKVYREFVWSEWQNTLLTRLHPNGAVIIIQTRWHKDDLSGRLLDEEGRIEDGGKWAVIKLPALAEENDPLGRRPGEALWPEHGFDEKWAEDKKKSVGSYAWAALYQQTPIVQEGGMFQREWFEIVEDYPRDCKKVRYWDLAATKPKQGSDPDWTAGALVGEKDGVYWIINIKRIRTTPAGVESLIRQTAELDGRSVEIYMEQEPGSSGVNTIDYYSRKVLNGFSFRGNKVTGSKEERANPVSAAAEAGNVKLVRGPWIQDFLDEVEAFPNGAHDDQIDAVSGCFEKLNKPKFVFV